MAKEDTTPVQVRIPTSIYSEMVKSAKREYTPLTTYLRKWIITGYKKDIKKGK